MSRWCQRGATDGKQGSAGSSPRAPLLPGTRLRSVCACARVVPVSARRHPRAVACPRSRVCCSACVCADAGRHQDCRARRVCGTRASRASLTPSLHPLCSLPPTFPPCSPHSRLCPCLKRSVYHSCCPASPPRARSAQLRIRPRLRAGVPLGSTGGSGGSWREGRGQQGGRGRRRCLPPGFWIWRTCFCRNGISLGGRLGRGGVGREWRGKERVPGGNTSVI